MQNLKNFSDYMHTYICPYCRATLRRNYEPLNHAYCHLCNKSFPAKANEYKEDKVVPDPFSLSNKTFKDIADIFCDRWTPEAAFVYQTFAVFKFKSKDDCLKMCLYIDEHEKMFDGLEFQTDNNDHLMMRVSTDVNP